MMKLKPEHAVSYRRTLEWPEEFIVSKTLVVCTSECPFLCTKIQWNPLCHCRLCYYEKKLPKSSNITSSHSFNAGHCPVPWPMPKELKFEAFFTAWFAAQKLYIQLKHHRLPTLIVSWYQYFVEKERTEKCGNHETIHFIGALFVFFSKARLEIKKSEV